MKKLLAALAFGLTAAALAHAQKPHTDREHLGFKGPVKSVAYERAKLEKRGGQEVEGRRVLGERSTFNAEGNIAESESYDADGAVTYQVTFRYAGGAKLGEGQIVQLTFNFGPRPAATPPGPRPMRPFSNKYKYKYDAEGRVREWTIEERGHVTLRVVYERKGDRREMWTYLERGQFTFREMDRFDARGDLAETAFLDPETGAVRYKYLYTAYEFDARGNWVKRLKTESGYGRPEVRTVEYRTITYH